MKTESLYFNLSGLAINFRPIINMHVSFDSWVVVGLEQSFVIVEPFDLTARTWVAEAAPMGATTAAAAAITASSARAAWMPAAKYDHDFSKALWEYKETGKIKGYMVLIVDSGKLVWMSHYDIEALKKRQ